MPRHCLSFAKNPQSYASICIFPNRNPFSFFGFPAEYWQHIRTTNPIESTFATVRLRTDKARGCFSAGTVEAMGFKLCMEAEKKRRRLKGHQKLDGVSKGDVYVDGELKPAA